MAGHDVCKVPQGGGCVAVCADVDVDAASVGRVADRPAVAKLAGDFLQITDVLVVEDRGCKFSAFSLDAGVADHPPSPALVVPATPCVVAAAVVPDCIFGSKVPCNHLRNLLAADAAHLDFDPDGLLLHVLDLLCNLGVHSM